MKGKRWESNNYPKQKAYEIPEQNWRYLLPPIFYRSRRPEGQVSQTPIAASMAWN